MTVDDKDREYENSNNDQRPPCEFMARQPTVITRRLLPVPMDEGLFEDCAVAGF